MFGQAFDNGERPHTLNEAIITWIPKTGTDFEEVGSYRPISLASRHSKEDLLVLSSDAEKLFDQVEWTYLFAALNIFETGNRLISWMKLLYNNSYSYFVPDQSVWILCRSQGQLG